jgi:hypothetical protein
MIRGIGPVCARRLVKAFGTDVFEIIEATPERLREVGGIGPSRAAKITAGWSDQRVIREIMVFLHAHGVGTARAVRIFKAYGTDAVQMMSENPCRLARDIRGVGFRTADLIAGKFGVEKTASIGVRAGVSFALSEAMGDGHCGLPRAELTVLAEKLLEVTRALIESAIGEELAKGSVTADWVGEAECIFLTGLYQAKPDLILEPLVRAALIEDFNSHGDITTRTVIPSGTRVDGAIRAREGGTASGMQMAALTFRLIDPSLRLQVLVPDGSAFGPGDILARMRRCRRHPVGRARGAELCGPPVGHRHHHRRLRGRDARHRGAHHLHAQDHAWPAAGGKAGGAARRGLQPPRLALRRDPDQGQSHRGRRRHPCRVAGR